MLQATLVQWITATLSALMGGVGVFCAVYSFASPDIAAAGIVLLSCAGALNYFGRP
jgi:hypothetical protein